MVINVELLWFCYGIVVVLLWCFVGYCVGYCCVIVDVLWLVNIVVRFSFV